MKFILGRKIGMSQIFDKEGKVIPLTWVEAGPCIITQIKTKEKDGYEAIQLGFIKKKLRKIKKSERGKDFKFLKEFQGISQKDQKFKKGEKIDVTFFSEGDRVKISGLSKGKGFQGVVKRWGFSGLPKTHGTKHMLRMPGSIGQSGPERVFKGKKMAGRTGYKRVTAKNLEIVKIDPNNNLLGIKGAVPGRKGTVLEIQSQ